MVTQLDSWLPAYEFCEHHERLVRAPASAVRRALHELDGSRIPLVRALMTLRALPGLVVAPRATLARMRAPRAAGLLGLASIGFTLLHDDEREIVVGLTGRFWRPQGEVVVSDPATFRDAPPPGCARAATNFLLTPRGEGETLVATDTRIHCADEAARRAFAWYWRAIRLGSGAIRHAMLRAIARRAERAAASLRARQADPRVGPGRSGRRRGGRAGRLR
jgi:hypothetical protein